jgi:hypothetical protein
VATLNRLAAVACGSAPALAARLQSGARIVVITRDCSLDDERLARAVLSHLTQGAYARDTLEGIVQWWLQKERIDDAVTHVLRVLDHLVGLGLVVERADRNGRHSYAIASERREEVRALLGKTEP